MREAYVEHIKQLNNRLIRAGINLELDLDTDEFHFNDEVLKLEHFLYINNMLKRCSSSKAIENLMEFKEETVDDWVRSKLSDEYDRIWSEKLKDLTENPVDAGVINKPLDSRYIAEADEFTSALDLDKNPWVEKFSQDNFIKSEEPEYEYEFEDSEEDSDEDDFDSYDDSTEGTEEVKTTEIDEDNLDSYSDTEYEYEDSDEEEDSLDEYETDDSESNTDSSDDSSDEDVDFDDIEYDYENDEDSSKTTDYSDEDEDVDDFDSYDDTDDEDLTPVSRVSSENGSAENIITSAEETIENDEDEEFDSFEDYDNADSDEEDSEEDSEDDFDSYSDDDDFDSYSEDDEEDDALDSYSDDEEDEEDSVDIDSYEDDFSVDDLEDEYSDSAVKNLPFTDSRNSGVVTPKPVHQTVVQQPKQPNIEDVVGDALRDGVNKGLSALMAKWKR